MSDNNKILSRLVHTQELFNSFVDIFDISSKAKMHGRNLEKSIHTYFNDTELLRKNHATVDKTNASKRFSLMVKAINSTKPIKFDGNSSRYKDVYVNEIFSIYCGLSHIKESSIRNLILENMNNFIYIIFHQEMNYLQLALTMDLVFKTEISTTGKGK